MSPKPGAQITCERGHTPNYANFEPSYHCYEVKVSSWELPVSSTVTPSHTIFISVMKHTAAVHPLLRAGDFPSTRYVFVRENCFCESEFRTSIKQQSDQMEEAKNRDAATGNIRAKSEQSWQELTGEPETKHRKYSSASIKSTLCHHHSPLPQCLCCVFLNYPQFASYSDTSVRNLNRTQTRFVFCCLYIQGLMF